MSKNKKLKKIHAIDLFCGIGGLTHGLGLSGIKVKAGFDIDPSCKFVYQTNNSGADFITADVRDVRFKDIEHSIRIITYDELIKNAFSAYSKFLAAAEKTGKLRALIEKIRSHKQS